MIVAVDDEAVFRCQHASANTIEWKINGTSLGDFHPPNITQTIFSSGSSTHTLSIQALASYNQTSVQCVAFLDTTMRRSEESSPVLLLIQGLSPLRADVMRIITFLCVHCRTTFINQKSQDSKFQPYVGASF